MLVYENICSTTFLISIRIKKYIYIGIFNTKNNNFNSGTFIEVRHTTRKAVGFYRLRIIKI